MSRPLLCTESETDPAKMAPDTADLASDDDAVRGGERLATHANVARIETGLRALAKKQIDDFV